jgi:hypothetical protein
MAYAPDPGALQRSLLTAGLGLMSNRNPIDLHQAILNSLLQQQRVGVPYNALQLLGLHPGGFMQPTYTPATPPMVSPQNLYRSPLPVFPSGWPSWANQPGLIDQLLRAPWTFSPYQGV